MVIFIRRLVFIIMLATTFCAFFKKDGNAESGPTVVELSRAQKNDLDRIEKYLDEIVSLRAKFLQVSSTGEISKGTFWLKKPGFLRFQYDPPSQILIIGDGTFLSYIDDEIEEIRNMFLSSTPLGFLANKKVRLKDDLAVSKVETSLAAIRYTFRKKSEPRSGAITLVFSDKPLKIRKWVVIDAKGIETEVTLSNLETGVEVEDTNFEIPRKYFVKDRDE
ncbi:MAG: hypothetical protein CMM20_04710 [Rhodospirillaceae bacterium]|nr:hypothetical protein [Rhodospirillaceae bacterium]